MIPNNSLASMYVWMIGDNSLLAIAQSNLLNNLERIVKIRTHTFLTSNGQTEFGVSRNAGSKRYYSWEDTLIDCRNAPSLVSSDLFNDFDEMILENRRFHIFKTDIEERSDGVLKIQAFHSILRGEENMRYNIKRSNRFENFDIVRIGLKVSASDKDEFKQGLNNLYNWENPFKIRQV